MSTDAPRTSRDASDALLHRVVDEAGCVDYDCLAGNDLDAALQAVAEADLGALRGADRYAFLLNAYNLTVLDAVRRRLLRPGRSPRNLSHPLRWLQFFLATPVRVAGRRLSLFRLEFQFIRPFLRRDPRGHFALVCAATGCPPLRGGVYHGEELDAELELAGRAFVRPGGGYSLDREAGCLRLNRIFKWYQRDFRAMGGVREVVVRYAPEDDARWLQENPYRIRYLRYDWNLNVAGGQS